MMDPYIFQQEFTALCKWYGQSVDRDRAMQWYGCLKEELSDREFERACRLVIRHEKFFPCPQDLIDRIKGSLLQRALIEWQAEPALRSIVGKKAWDSLPPDEGITSEIKFRRKQFLEAYEAFAHTASPSELTPTPPLPRIASAQTISLEREFAISQESGEEARARIRRIFAEKGLGDFRGKSP